MCCAHVKVRRGKLIFLCCSFDQAPGAPVIMRKWVLYGIAPLLAADTQALSDGLSGTLPQRLPSVLTGVVRWAARSWRWPASLWAKATAVATAGDISDSATGITAGSADEEELGHALVSSSSYGPPSSAVASDLVQQSISSSADRVIWHDVNGDLAEIRAVHAEAPTKSPLTPQRGFTWSGNATEACSSAADTDELEPAVAISRSGEILVNPKQHLQRASTWPRASSTGPALAQAPSALAQSFSEPDLAISDDGDINLASCPGEDCLTSHASSPQAAGSVAETSQAASDRQFHKTYVVKAGRAGDNDIQEVQGPLPSEAVGGSSPRIAAVQSHSLQLQEDKEEVEPQWKVKVDARTAKAQQHKNRTPCHHIQVSTVLVEYFDEQSLVHHGFLLLLY